MLGFGQAGRDLFSPAVPVAQAWGPEVLFSLLFLVQIGRFVFRCPCFRARSAGGGVQLDGSLSHFLGSGFVWSQVLTCTFWSPRWPWIWLQCVVVAFVDCDPAGAVSTLKLQLLHEVFRANCPIASHPDR